MFEKPLYSIGSFEISYFGLMLVFAFLGSYLQLRWGMKRLGVGDEEDASALVFAAGLGGIAGAKIYYAVLNRDWHLLFDRSGLVWYGGFIVGALGVLFTMWRRKLPGWPMADVAAPALSLGYGIGRLGCFLVGDDYGRPTDLPWHIAFKWGLPPTRAGNLRQMFHVAIPPSVPDDQLLQVHPTQLYETAMALAIWGFAVWLFRRRPQTGTVALTVLGLLSVERFLIEFLRANDDRFLGPFTLAQAISVAVLLILLGIAGYRRGRQVPRAA